MFQILLLFQAMRSAGWDEEESYTPGQLTAFATAAMKHIGQRGANSSVKLAELAKYGTKAI